jgi:acyl dehydratase
MGRFYEELEVGQRYDTPRRIIGEADIKTFTELTADHNPLHVDDAFAAEWGFGGRIAHGPMIVGIAFGLMSRIDFMDGTVLGLLDIGWTFKGPVRPGDEIGVILRVTGKRMTRKPDRGVVDLEIDVTNQRGELVQAGIAKAMIRREQMQDNS